MLIVIDSSVGTQASFLEIFHGDGSKIDALNEILCQKAGFPECFDIPLRLIPGKLISVLPMRFRHLEQLSNVLLATQV
jgi:hypothetical protein